MNKTILVLAIAAALVAGTLTTGKFVGSQILEPDSDSFDQIREIPAW